MNKNKICNYKINLKKFNNMTWPDQIGNVYKLHQNIKASYSMRVIPNIREPN